MGGAELTIGGALSSASISLAGALTVLLFVVAIDHLRAQQRFNRRLARFEILAAPDPGLAGLRVPAGADVLRRLGGRLARRQPPERLRALHEQCVQAGLGDRLGAEELLGLRAVAALAGVALGSLLAVLAGVGLGLGLGGPLVPTVLSLAAIGGSAGYLIPSLVLGYVARRRRDAIERLLPNAVDVLAVSLEAGLSFDTAVGILCERANNPLVVELRRYLADLRMGRSRREALKALVERTGSPGLSELAVAVIQADELGTGLVRALRGQSVTLRAARRVRAEELARQAPIKLMFPMVLFILPVLFIVTIGPAVLRAIAIFGKS